MAKLHIGKKIREVVDKSDFSIIEFAKHINLTRDGAYKIFAKDTIDTEQLRHISKVLHHDFFSYLSASVSNIREIDNPYGFATKEELNKQGEVLLMLVKEVKELREAVLPLVKKQARTKKK
jgi:hypothetical protein